mmetsp:Transcript_27220/g.43664  ORF Transcript_27220/g.43664 Transcript_27220/m.43664 type:complete len:267 (-) Transcript_27220:43-843(-)
MVPFEDAAKSAISKAPDPASNCSTRASDTTAPASTLGSTLTVLNLWVTTAGTTVVGVHTLIIQLLQPTTATYGCAINERHELPTSPLARAGLDNLEMFMGEDTIVETKFFEALRQTKFWLATFFFGNSARLRGRHVVRSRPWSICTHSRLPRSIKSTVPLANTSMSSPPLAPCESANSSRYSTLTTSPRSRTSSALLLRRVVINARFAASSSSYISTASAVTASPLFSLNFSITAFTLSSSCDIFFPPFPFLFASVFADFNRSFPP